MDDEAHPWKISPPFYPQTKHTLQVITNVKKKFSSALANKFRPFQPTTSENSSIPPYFVQDATLL